MSDVEHELLLENRALRHEVERVRELALRALVTAISAQDSSSTRHEAWLDNALTNLHASSSFGRNQ